MSGEITIREVSIDKATEVNASIIEFAEPYTQEYFKDRYTGKEHLILVAYADNKAAGYLIGYNRYDDKSFYCWMAGVNPKFRKKGILKQLMNYEEIWAKEKGYTTIKIKTRNSRREMLSYLVKYGYLFTEIARQVHNVDNEILLEKKL